MQLKAEAACGKLGEEQLWFCPASHSMKFSLFGTSQGGENLIISDKPLFPRPRELSWRWGEEDAWPSAGPVCEG